jgi:hypothetical protein
LLPAGQEQIVLRRFDLDKELERSGKDYLAVVSRPRRIVLPGKTFEYQLDIRSKSGKTKCRLESGPKGMEVSETGLVRWPVKNLPKGGAASVCVTVTDDSGRSGEHRFELATSEKSESAAATASKAKEIARDTSSSAAAAGDRSASTAGKPRR